MNKNNPRYIIIHCSAVSEKQNFDQFNAINIYHRDERFFPVSSLGFYIGYQRLITGGKNYQCRLDSDEGAHCNQQVDGLSMNLQSLGICWAGDGDKEIPSDIHYKLLRQQVLDWQDKYNIPNTNVKFHREFAIYKTCPGTLLDDSWIKLLLTRPEISNPLNINVSSGVGVDIIKNVIVEDKNISDMTNKLQVFFIKLFNWIFKRK